MYITTSFSMTNDEVIMLTIKTFELFILVFITIKFNKNIKIKYMSNIIDYLRYFTSRSQAPSNYEPVRSKLKF